MSEFESLSVPEQIVVKRLSFDEPLVVINAWLSTEGFKAIDEEGLGKLNIKYHELIKNMKSDSSGDSIFKELVELKNLLISKSNITNDPKAIAQLSNSINALSKTISDFVDKKKSEKEESHATPQEFLSILKFLRDEKYIDFNEVKFNELSKHLSSSFSGK